MSGLQSIQGGLIIHCLLNIIFEEKEDFLSILKGRKTYYIPILKLEGIQGFQLNPRGCKTRSLLNQVLEGT